jgi:hypothetical protein
MMDFKSKKILFIAPKFYNYHQEIIELLELKNAKVTFFAEDIYTTIYRFSNKIIPNYANYLKEQYQNLIVDSVQNNGYDFVFVIRGGILNPRMLSTLKSKLPNAKFIMYQWDSNQQSKYENIISFFDTVKTFDKEDAQKYKIDYLPLYYSRQYDEIKRIKEEKKFDIVFFGAYHSDRLDVIKVLDNFCSMNNLKFKYHLYITKMALFRLICSGKIKIKDLKYFKTYTVDTKEILDSYKCAFSILDIELNIQNGLTMRTFEALGSGLKLITTNSNIAKEPFFSKNIKIVDRDNICIDLNFFKEDFSEGHLISEYYIENWLETLFSYSSSKNN